MSPFPPEVMHNSDTSAPPPELDVQLSTHQGTQLYTTAPPFPEMSVGHRLDLNQNSYGVSDHESVMSYSARNPIVQSQSSHGIPDRMPYSAPPKSSYRSCEVARAIRSALLRTQEVHTPHQMSQKSSTFFLTSPIRTTGATIIGLRQIIQKCRSPKKSSHLFITKKSDVPLHSFLWGLQFVVY